MEHSENNLLFVYGTLLLAANSFAKFLRKNSEIAGQGKLRGELYDLGEYPGAVCNAASGSFILGTIYKMPNTAAVLENLDYYEGIGQQGCEYVRNLAEIETAEGTKTCWVYTCITDCSNKRLIADGDYLRYKGMR